MIFLAIDEMQSAECRVQKLAEANAAAWFQPISALCIPCSALSQLQDEREDEEARLERAHSLAQRVDE